MRKFSLSLLANAVNSGYYQGERCLSPMFFALLTCWHVQFSKIFAFLFSPQINFYLWAKLVLKENPEITKQWQSNLIFLCSGKHSFETVTVQKVSYSKPSHNKSHWQFKHQEVLTSKSSTLGYSCIFKKFLPWNFGKTPSSRQRFCSALHRLAWWI